MVSAAPTSSIVARMDWSCARSAGLSTSALCISLAFAVSAATRQRLASPGRVPTDRPWHPFRPQAVDPVILDPGGSESTDGGGDKQGIHPAGEERQAGAEEIAEEFHQSISLTRIHASPT